MIFMQSVLHLWQITHRRFRAEQVYSIPYTERIITPSRVKLYGRHKINAIKFCREIFPDRFYEMFRNHANTGFFSDQP